MITSMARRRARALPAHLDAEDLAQDALRDMLKYRPGTLTLRPVDGRTAALMARQAFTRTLTRARLSERRPEGDGVIGNQGAVVAGASRVREILDVLRAMRDEAVGPGDRELLSVVIDFTEAFWRWRCDAGRRRAPSLRAVAQFLNRPERDVRCSARRLKVRFREAWTGR